MKATLVTLMLLLTPFLAACAEPIPRYAAADAPTTLDTVIQAHRQVETVATAGRLTLRDPGRGSVTLDAALVARAPDHLRIRAWKLNRPVADITLHGERLRVDLSDGFDPDAFADALGHVRNALPGFAGINLDEPPARLHVEGDRVHATWHTPGGEVTCEIDRATRTIRRWRFHAGTVELERYRLLESGQVWPMRIVARGSQREAILRLDWVEINEALTAGALTPVVQGSTTP